jgi:hypothetical protein
LRLFFRSNSVKPKVRKPKVRKPKARQPVNRGFHGFFQRKNHENLQAQQAARLPDNRDFLHEGASRRPEQKIHKRNKLPGETDGAAASEIFLQSFFKIGCWKSLLT